MCVNYWSRVVITTAITSQFPFYFTSPVPVYFLEQSGGFYSAEDADSVPALGGPEKREGAFCVWTASEIRDLLPEVVEGATGAATQADIFMHHYGVKEQGNVAPEQVINFNTSHVATANLSRSCFYLDGHEIITHRCSSDYYCNSK